MEEASSTGVGPEEQQDNDGTFQTTRRLLHVILLFD